MAGPRCTQAQLERAIGGAAQLLQLVDRKHTDNLQDASCQAFITDVLLEGNSHVNGYVGMAADLGDPALQSAPTLVNYELEVDVYLCWLKGAGGQAMPEQVKARYDYVDGELQKIGARQKGVGLVNRPAAAQPIQQVNDDTTADFFSSKGPRRRFDGWS